MAPDRAETVHGDPAYGTSDSGIAIDIVTRTNAARSDEGLAALQTSAALMRAASLHAEQMAAAGQMAHTIADATYPRLEDRLQAAGYEWRSAGENIAAGYSSAAQAMSGWMQSSGHRANILNAGFTEIGVGYATGATGQPYYVQVFGRPR